MIDIPGSPTLRPQTRTLRNGRPIYLFPSDSTELLKMDLLFEAGSAYQPQLLCALAANKLCMVASRRMDARQVAEFMDYRGVIVETHNDVHQSSMTVYMLRRLAGEVIPLVGEMLQQPAFEPTDFDLWAGRQRQEIAVHAQQGSSVARRLFYEKLFGEEHPLGRHAAQADVERLGLQAVRDYYGQRYSLGGCTVVLSGMVDDGVVDLVDSTFGLAPSIEMPRPPLPEAQGCRTEEMFYAPIESATQSTLRVGRIVPLRWDDEEYARLMLLTVMLGGYFGSRLMANLRERNGYTYGIYARTQIYRGAIVFFITADVAADKADEAAAEIRRELVGLHNRPADSDELEMVKNVLAGDFVRSVDGVFEQSSRFCDMFATGVTEALTDNMRTTIQTADAEQLRRLALRVLPPEAMICCRAGL